MDADTLRLLLIVAGGLFLAGLYIWERRRADAGADEPYEDGAPDADKLEPQLGPWGDEADDTAAAGDPRGQPAAPEPPELPEPPDEHGPTRPESPLILLLHLTPRTGVFTGEAIVHAAERCGIEPGEMGIFHRYAAAESPEDSLFRVANMVKPGTFSFGAMAEFESPGLTLFSQAEGASDDPSRLEAMLAAARCLATELKGQIRDETRELLTPEAEARMQDRVHELIAWRLTDTR